MDSLHGFSIEAVYIQSVNGRDPIDSSTQAAYNEILGYNRGTVFTANNGFRYLFSVADWPYGMNTQNFYSPHSFAMEMELR